MKFIIVLKWTIRGAVFGASAVTVYRLLLLRPETSVIGLPVNKATPPGISSPPPSGVGLSAEPALHLTLSSPQMWLEKPCLIPDEATLQRLVAAGGGPDSPWQRLCADTLELPGINGSLVTQGRRPPFGFRGTRPQEYRRERRLIRRRLGTLVRAY